jgi:sortase (surface protein transpeptidase)
MMRVLNLISLVLFFIFIYVTVTLGYYLNIDSKVINKTASKIPTSLSCNKNKEVLNPLVDKVTLEIPSINLVAEIVTSKLVNNQLQAPKDNKVGISPSGALPGELGTTLIIGHYDSKTGPAVFYDLKLLNINDSIFIVKNEKRLKYLIYDMKIYPRGNLDIEKIFGYSNKSKYLLNLITCVGSFNKELHTYNNRLVIYSNLVN